MTDWYMYNEIQKLKSMGFSKSRTADKLQINFRTVKRYWDMTPADYSDAFKDLHRNMRNSTASRYEQEILAWLEQHPDLSSAQIYDWLYEKYQTPPVVAERTMRRYIAWLREFPYESCRYQEKNAIVSFLPGASDGPTILKRDSDLPCTISGNNVDGFIITEWRRAHG